MKNFVIINYNTQEFVDKLIMSINKFVKDAHIFVFDNSDNSKFVNTFANVNVLDNTCGQIINFDDFLSKYPNKIHSGAMQNNWASAKHCYTIEKCIELCNDNFVLLDSDVLIKRDLSELFDNECVYIGEVLTQPNRKKRVAPYLCFINVKMCKENNLHYFDENYMHGCCVTPQADEYDTGGGFFINTQGYKHKDIKLDDYIVHYGHGSWVKNGYNYNITPDDFFNDNVCLWRK